VKSFLNGWKIASATGSKRQAASDKLQAPSNKHRPALMMPQLKYINKLESEK